MEKEIWRPVKGYEGYYEISNFGRLKSLERKVKQGNHFRFVPEKIKKPHMSGDGYPAYTLCKDCKSRMIRTHLLIARAFIPNPDNKGYVDHINTDKNDFSIKNLRWVTAKENANNPLTLRHCRENTYIKEVSDKAKRTKIERGCKTAPRKVYQFSKEAKFIKEWFCPNTVQQEIGIHATAIRDCCNKKRFSAGGFLWSYNKDIITPYKKPISVKAKKISQYDLEGNLIKTWESYTEAARFLGRYNSNFIRDVKKKPIQGGFLWKFNE